MFHMFDIHSCLFKAFICTVNNTHVKRCYFLYMFDMFDIHSCLFKAFICTVHNEATEYPSNNNVNSNSKYLNKAILRFNL